MAEDRGFIKPTYSFRAHPEHSKGNRVYGAEDDDDDDDDDQPVVQYDIKIDESLLIDMESLYIGVMISEGGHSVVYEGLYKTMPVAIKILQPDKASSVSPDRKEKFLREIVMLSRVKHDNLVMFIGASIEPTMLIVTELMRGGSLKKFLWSIRPRCLDLQLSISFALNISRVMECLHGNGIIHRDLKPDNLLLTEDQKKLKLADFGLAREETLVEMMTAEAGTYRWMAPELFSTVPLPVGKKKHYDHKVDVYSFSMVLWELLTNCTPFKGMSSIQAAYAAAQNRRPSVENLPKDIIPLLESCWADDPARRPEFTEITDALSDLLNTPSSPQTRAPQVVGIEHQKHNLAADSPGTQHLMDESKGMRSKKLLKSSSVKFLRNCFGR